MKQTINFLPAVLPWPEILWLLLPGAEDFCPGDIGRTAGVPAMLNLFCRLKHDPGYFPWPGECRGVLVFSEGISQIFPCLLSVSVRHRKRVQFC